MAAFSIGGQVGIGLIILGTMLVLALMFLAGGRSETIRGLRGDERDERAAAIQLRAAAFMGLALFGTIVTGALVRAAQGQNPGEYGVLGLVANISFVAAVVFLNRRY